MVEFLIRIQSRIFDEKFNRRVLLLNSTSSRKSLRKKMGISLTPVSLRKPLFLKLLEPMLRLKRIKTNHHHLITYLHLRYLLLHHISRMVLDLPFHHILLQVKQKDLVKIFPAPLSVTTINIPIIEIIYPSKPTIYLQTI